MDKLWNYRKKILKRGRKYFAVNILEAILVLVILIIPRVFVLPKNVVNFYSENIFPKIALLGNSFSDIFVFSLTEVLVICGSVSAIIYVIYVIVQIIKAEKRIGIRRLIFRRFITVVLTIALFASATGTLMHKLNYYRSTAASRLDIKGDYSDYYDFLETLEWAYKGMIYARMQLGEDYNGVSHMITDFDTTVSDLNDLLDYFNYTYDMGMSTNFIKCKPVMCSHYWSYTNIVGMYFSIFGEANINTDNMNTLEFPLTVAHEIIHAKGYAREYDANSIGVLALIFSERADFRYCGYYKIFSNLYSETCRYADSLGLDEPDIITSDYAAVVRDIEAQEAYWKQIDEEIENTFLLSDIDDISESINNLYLKSNGQKEGTATYNVSPNIYVDFYRKYVIGE